MTSPSWLLVRPPILMKKDLGSGDHSDVDPVTLGQPEGQAWGSKGGID